jgi:hypothetical protein
VTIARRVRLTVNHPNHINRDIPQILATAVVSQTLRAGRWTTSDDMAKPMPMDHPLGDKWR